MPLYRSSSQTNIITIRKNSGADVGTRGRLNLIEGAGVTLGVVDDPGSSEVDVTVTAAPSMPAYTVTGVDVDRVINVDAMTLNELANVVGTFLQDFGVA